MQHAEETPLLVRLSTCPNCESSVPNEPSPKEFAEMTNDGRVRLIKALKVSYWKQFEHGMLSREAVQALINLADTAMDEEEGYKRIFLFVCFLISLDGFHVRLFILILLRLFPPFRHLSKKGRLLSLSSFAFDVTYLRPIQTKKLVSLV